MCGEALTIDRLRETDAEACKAIWLACFPDDPPEVPELFLRDILRPEEGLVCRMDGRPVSMVLMLPAHMAGDGERLPIQYIYAAATHPAYQHRGLFARLLQAALEQAKQQGMAASFLRPGEPGLIDYYARFGYRPFFTVRREHVLVDAGGEARSNAWTPIPAEAYASLRRRLLPQWAARFVDWPDRLVECAVTLAEMDGGGAFGDGQDGCALCVPRDGYLLVHELLCEKEQRKVACGALLRRFAFEQAQVLSPVAADGEAFGLLCPLSELGEKRLQNARGAYMGIALE